LAKGKISDIIIQNVTIGEKWIEGIKSKNPGSVDFGFAHYRHCVFDFSAAMV
jgi:hypothetical protein